MGAGAGDKSFHDLRRGVTVGHSDAEACVRCSSLYLKNEYSLNITRRPTIFIFSCCCPTIGLATPCSGSHGQNRVSAGWALTWRPGGEPLPVAAGAAAAPGGPRVLPHFTQ